MEVIRTIDRHTGKLARVLFHLRLLVSVALLSLELRQASARVTGGLSKLDPILTEPGVLSFDRCGDVQRFHQKH